MLLDAGEEMISAAVVDDRGCIISGTGRGGKPREAQLSRRIFVQHLMHRARRGRALEISWKAEVVAGLPPEAGSAGSAPAEPSGEAARGTKSLVLEVVDEAPALL